MKEKNIKPTGKYLWHMSLRESIAVTLLGTLMALSNTIRIPMHIPGHTGLIWITILTFCCLTFRKAGSGVLAGVVAGFVADVLGQGNGGPFVFFKYFLPAMSMDLIFNLIPHTIKKWYLTAIIAAFAHWTKLLVNYIIGTILNVPQGFLIMGVQIATINHIIFGFCAGCLAYFIYAKVNRYTHRLFIQMGG